MEEIFNTAFGFLGKVTGAIRGVIASVAPEKYVTLILLGASMVAGYFLYKKFPNWGHWILYGLIIFLLLYLV